MDKHKELCRGCGELIAYDLVHDCSASTRPTPKGDEPMTSDCNCKGIVHESPCPMYPAERRLFRSPPFSDRPADECKHEFRSMMGGEIHCSMCGHEFHTNRPADEGDLPQSLAGIDPDAGMAEWKRPADEGERCRHGNLNPDTCVDCRQLDPADPPASEWEPDGSDAPIRLSPKVKPNPALDKALKEIHERHRPKANPPASEWEVVGFDCLRFSNRHHPDPSFLIHGPAIESHAGCPDLKSHAPLILQSDADRKLADERTVNRHLVEAVGKQGLLASKAQGKLAEAEARNSQWFTKWAGAQAALRDTDSRYRTLVEGVRNRLDMLRNPEHIMSSIRTLLDREAKGE